MNESENIGNKDQGDKTGEHKRKINSWTILGEAIDKSNSQSVDECKYSWNNNSVCIVFTCMYKF